MRAQKWPLKCPKITFVEELLDSILQFLIARPVNFHMLFLIVLFSKLFSLQRSQKLVKSVVCIFAIKNVRIRQAFSQNYKIFTTLEILKQKSWIAQNNVRFRLRGPAFSRKVESILRLCRNDCLGSPIQSTMTER